MPSNKLFGDPITAAQNTSLFSACAVQRELPGDQRNTPSDSTTAAEATQDSRKLFLEYIHTSLREDGSTAWAAVLSKPRLSADSLF